MQLYGHHLSVNLHCAGQNTPLKVINRRFEVKQLAAVRTPPCVNLHCAGQNTPVKVIKHRFGVKQLAAVRTQLQCEFTL